MYLITDEIKNELKKPMGILITTEDIPVYIGKDDLIATCGDVTTDTLSRLGYRMKIAIVDGRTKRSSLNETVKLEGYIYINVISSPGTISDDLMLAIRDAVESQNNVVINVTGEEDLGTLPLVQYMPAGSKVLYGQPDEGIVLIKIEEKIKNSVKEILQRMVRI